MVDSRVNKCGFWLHVSTRFIEMIQVQQGRTILLIAHRLSTIKNADEILVLESGKIVERGNHSYLISQKGLYYKMVSAQELSGDHSKFLKLFQQVLGRDYHYFLLKHGAEINFLVSL